MVGDAHRVVRGARRHEHERLAGAAGRLLERGDEALVHLGDRKRLPPAVARRQAAFGGRLLRERLNAAGDRVESRLDDPTRVEREPGAAGHDVDDPRLELDLADRADGPVAGLAREPLHLEDHPGGHRRDVEPEVHGRRAGVVGAALEDDVGVDVAGDRRHDAEAVARVLEDAGLLDVELDPAREAVEDAERLAPP